MWRVSKFGAAPGMPPWFETPRFAIKCTQIA
jgi:hypothetical protein